MKIQADKLSKAMASANVNLEQLAGAIVSPSLKPDRALSALANWLAGRDHPRAKADHVRRLAGALGVEAKDIVRFTSQVRHHRGSPRKARLVADLVRGKPVDQALNMLSFTTKRAAVNIKKALNAAIADAELAEADVTRLFVAESRVDEAPRIKRFHPKDRGRAHPIIKPLSHITIGVEEKPLKGARR